MVDFSGPRRSEAGGWTAKPEPSLSEPIVPNQQRFNDNGGVGKPRNPSQICKSKQENCTLDANNRQSLRKHRRREAALSRLSCAFVSWWKFFCVSFARSCGGLGGTASSASVSALLGRSASSGSLAFVCQRGNNSCCFHRIFLPRILGRGGGSGSEPAAPVDQRPFVSPLSLPTAHTLLPVRGTRGEHPLLQLLLSPV